MIPQKLKKGDEVRVISPARSMAIISKDSRKIATATLEKLGLKVSFSKNVEEKETFNSSPVKSRVSDLHEAFSDKNVKLILTTIGGFNSNQILDYLDYNLIKSNPKIICGYSDITALSNAIYAKTGLINYSGPHYSTFGMKKGLDYTIDYFEKCLFSKSAFEIKASKNWSEDEWYKDQENRKFKTNKGMFTINSGSATGKIIGGNLCTFILLNGTPYKPSFKDTILFIEDCVEEGGEAFPEFFDRHLQALIHQPDFNKVKGIVIGRFQSEANMTKENLIKIIKDKQELDNIPIVAGFDFGHTTPQITFPMGGTCKLDAKKGSVKLKINKH